jgi:hypothetical protein
LNARRTSIFSHPDYTVGFGIAPNPALSARGLRDKLITAGREFHHAPKIDHIKLQTYYTEKKTFWEVLCLKYQPSLNWF